MEGLRTTLCYFCTTNLVGLLPPPMPQSHNLNFKISYKKKLHEINFVIVLEGSHAPPEFANAPLEGQPSPVKNPAFFPTLPKQSPPTSLYQENRNTKELLVTAIECGKQGHLVAIGHFHVTMFLRVAWKIVSFGFFFAPSVFSIIYLIFQRNLMFNLENERKY